MTALAKPSAFVALLLLTNLASSHHAHPIRANEPQPAETTPSEKLRLSFVNTPWSDVLEWVAQANDLSMSLDHVPPGTVSLSDATRKFTPREALDEVSGVLLTKGYSLLRRNRMLLILDFEDEHKLVHNLLVETPVSDLEDRGEFELTKCRFDVGPIDVDVAAEQIRPLIGTYGSMLVFRGTRELLVTETGGNLRVARRMLEKLQADPGPSLWMFRLKSSSAKEVLAVAAPLLGLESQGTAAQDRSIRISSSTDGKALFATGEAAMIRLLEQVVSRVDKLASDGPVTAKRSFAAFPVKLPQVALKAIQEVFAGTSLRVEVDEHANRILIAAEDQDRRTIEQKLTKGTKQGLDCEEPDRQTFVAFVSFCSSPLRAGRHPRRATSVSFSSALRWAVCRRFRSAWQRTRSIRR